MGSRRNATNAGSWNANKHFDCITWNKRRNMEKMRFFRFSRYSIPRAKPWSKHNLIEWCQRKAFKWLSNSPWTAKEVKRIEETMIPPIFALMHNTLCTKLKCFYLLDFTYLLFYCWRQDLFQCVQGFLFFFFFLLICCVGKPMRIAWNYDRKFSFLNRKHHETSTSSLDERMQ